jgi:hypothetical protein
VPFPGRSLVPKRKFVGGEIWRQILACISIFKTNFFWVHFRPQFD